MKSPKPRYNKRKFIAAFFVAMALFSAIRHGFGIDIPLRAETASPLLAQTDDFSADTPQSESSQPEIVTESTATADADANSSTANHEADDEHETEKDDETDDETSLFNNIPDSLRADTSEDTTFQPSSQPSSQRGRNGHRVIGVHSWHEAFPDSQAVQLAAAQRNGIPPCTSREQAMAYVRSHKLVDITHSPFYAVDDLTHSMPYLVPKAQQLLNTICLNFIDSLTAKGMPPHLPMVTSVLRTSDDVSRLQRGNKNATSNSCHCYGTTVDITYNRFVPLTGYYDPRTELTRWSLPMKQVLAEVLRDLREQGYCYVKYERKQACFHLTVR